MTMEELEKTRWEKKFKRECPSSYKEAMELALSPHLSVSIRYADNSETHQWVIEALDKNPKDTGFLMEKCKNMAQAVKLCQKMGWDFRFIFWREIE